MKQRLENPIVSNFWKMNKDVSDTATRFRSGGWKRASNFSAFVAACYVLAWIFGTGHGAKGQGAYGPLISAKPAASSSWTPNTPGTLVNWYDASVLGLANNANVTSWTDEKGSNNMTGTGGSYPVYKTNQKNGLSTVNFNGSQYLLSGGSNSSPGTYTFTIAAVVEVQNYSGNYNFVGANSLSAVPSHGGLIVRTNSSTGILEADNSDVALIGTSSGALGSSAYHLFVLTCSWNGSSGTYAFYIDGSASGSGSQSTALTPSGSTFALGATDDSGGIASILTGYIGEVEIYNSVLGSTDLASLHTYIANKWATP